MSFLVDDLGHKKRLRPAYWVHVVRTCSAEVRSVYYKDALRQLINFIPKMIMCHEISVISKHVKREGIVEV